VFAKRGAGDVMAPEVAVQALAESHPHIISRMLHPLGTTKLGPDGEAGISVPTGLIYQSTPFSRFFLRLILQYQFKRLAAQQRLALARAEAGSLRTRLLRLLQGLGLVIQPRRQMSRMLSELDSVISRELLAARPSPMQTDYQNWLEQPTQENTETLLAGLVEVILQEQDPENRQKALYTLSELCRQVPLFDGRKVGAWAAEKKSLFLPEFLWRRENRLQLRRLLKSAGSMPLAALDPEWKSWLRQPRRTWQQAA
ncbi:hypothetical protein JW933_11320, partial [candidate division FCPU426 bacterium]|nr:hypothetical protein [candidate division FCPU426 bacterium]